MVVYRGATATSLLKNIYFTNMVKGTVKRDGRGDIKVESIDRSHKDRRGVPLCMMNKIINPLTLSLYVKKFVIEI